MAKLIVTMDNKDETFRVYDLKSLKKTFSKQKIAKLSSEDLADSGKAPFRPFGVDYDKKNIYIASNEKIGSFDRKTYKFNGVLEVKCYVNTHQILINENILYITNTANDSLGMYNLKDFSVKYLNVRDFKITHSIVDTKDAYEHDDCHLNSLCFHDNKLYFCLNNYGFKPSGYYCYNPVTEKTKLIASAGTKGHGIVILGNDLYTLSTGTGELLKINLRSKKVASFKITTKKPRSFLRGLAEYNGNLLIGHSNDYRSKQDPFKAQISIFDTSSGVNSCFIEFKMDEIINDFRVMR